MIADPTVINPFDSPRVGRRTIPSSTSAAARELGPYLELRERGTRLGRWMEGVDRRPRRMVDFLVDLNQRLAKDIGSTISMEPGDPT